MGSTSHMTARVATPVVCLRRAPDITHVQTFVVNIEEADDMHGVAPVGSAATGGACSRAAKSDGDATPQHPRWSKKSAGDWHMTYQRPQPKGHVDIHVSTASAEGKQAATVDNEFFWYLPALTLRLPTHFHRF